MVRPLEEPIRTWHPREVPGAVWTNRAYQDNSQILKGYAVRMFATSSNPNTLIACSHSSCSVTCSPCLGITTASSSSPKKASGTSSTWTSAI